jgi:flagellar assembly protein FliH
MASILKQHQFRDGQNVGQAEVFNWEDVASRAKQYLESVRRQAAQLLDQAKAQAEQIRQQAAQDGISQGTAQVESMAQDRAVKLAQAEIATAMKHAEQLSEELAANNQQWLRQWQHETVTLAIAVAEKIIARQIDTDPEILLGWIAESVRMVQGQRRMELRLHSSSLARLGDSLPKCLGQMGRLAMIDIIADDQIEPQGLVLQDADGRVDMQLTTQLARLREEIV